MITKVAIISMSVNPLVFERQIFGCMTTIEYHLNLCSNELPRSKL